MFRHMIKLIKKVLSRVLLALLVFSMLPVEHIVVLALDGGIPSGVVDRISIAQRNKNVVDNFRFGIREAEASTDPASLEYTISLGPVNGSTAANYVYASLFNPAASGKTAVVKRLFIQSNAVAAAAYNDLNIRRITTASAGTAVAVTDITKKNTGSVNSIMDVRTTGPTVTFAGTADSRIAAVVAAAAVGAPYGWREINFDGNEPLVLQPGEGIALYQPAAGNANQRMRLTAEWVEQVSTPASQGEYMFAYPRVEVAATANYVYNSFFNPAASGKTAVVKRIAIDVDADTRAVYTNNITIRRITAASGGTAITAANVPKKHSGSANSVMDIRRTGVTVTLAGTANSRIVGVMPPAVASQPHAHIEYLFATGDEKLILQPGEGIALYSEAAGDIDQLVRMTVEWGEQVSAPASAGEYVMDLGPVAGSATANYNYISFFNPAASGKTAVIKRIAVRVNAAAAAVYVPMTLRRTTTASGGTAIPVADVPKKHTGTANSVMDLRTTGPAVTLAGTADSRLASVITAGAVGQIGGQQMILFDGNEKLVLQPGEGIALYQEAAGDIDFRVRVGIEWGEQASAPASQGQYMMNLGPVVGWATANYNYVSFFNPAASGKTAVIKRIAVRVNLAAAAVYIPLTLRRTTSASGGTAIAVANVPKKHTGTANSIMDVRTAGPAVTLVGTASSRLISVTTPGAIASAAAPQTNGYRELIFKNDEAIVLQPGEGIALYQEAAGDPDFRISLNLEWGEQVSAPASAGEYLFSSGTVNGSTAANYVYGSFFNPLASGKDYVVKRIGIRANRTGTLVAPGYIAATIRPITTASAGTAVSAADVPKKHTGTANATADIRTTNPTVTFAGTIAKRLLGVTVPGAVGQISGINEAEIIFGNELVIKSGEGIALYQEAAAGDALMRYFLTIEWMEVASTGAPTPVITTYTNTTEGGLNYAAACTGCGARIGGGAGFRQSVTITGTDFGTVSAGSRSTATDNIKVGTHQIADANITVWTPTSITFLTDSATAGDTDTDWGANFGGTSALTVTAGSQTSTGVNFYVFPQVTSVTQPVGLGADTAREYDAADTDGVITLNGTRFGSSQGTGSVTIVAQTATIGSWTNTAIQAQVPPAIIDSTNTGSISMVQGTGTNGKNHTYANTLRILPRITGFTPTSASEGGAVTVNGNHFCQSVSCPVAFGVNDKVTFTSAKDAAVFTSWSATAIVTAVPVGAVTGNVVVTSNTYTSNGKSFTVLSNTPLDPTSLGQWKNAALTQPIAIGGVSSSTPIYLTMIMEVPGISGGTLYPQIEYKAIGTPFVCGAGVCASATEGTGVAGPGPIDCGLTANGCAIAISPADNVYHWQARVRHNRGGSDYFSNWVSFDGANPETSTDFQIDTTKPTITSVSSGTPGSNNATITWSTASEIATSRIEYNTSGTFTGGYDCAGTSECTALADTAPMVNSHSVSLSNLNSGTTYSYLVRSKDAAGNESTSITYTFTTSSVTQPAKTIQAYINGATGVVSSATPYYFTVNAPETAPSVKNAYAEVVLVALNTGSVSLQVNGVPARSYTVSAATPTLYRFLYQITSPNTETNLNLNDSAPCSNSIVPGTPPECNKIIITPTTTNLYVLSAKIITTYAYTP